MTSTSTGQLPEPWKTTAATLFNPYLSLSQVPNSVRQQSVRTRILTPSRHSRAPPESLVGNGNLQSTSTIDLNTKSKSKQFPNPNAAEEVSIYVQQMIHNQFCGRSGTPSDVRYDDHTLRTPTSTPNNIQLRKRIPSARQQSRVSQYELDDFFNTADEQMSRMASAIHGRESSFSENLSQYSGSPRYKSNAGERLTLGDMCHLASNVGDKMSQSKEKVGLEAIRGFRLPSARLTYEPYEHHPMETPLVLGQPIVNDRIRLSDVLTDDNYSNTPMIEIVDQNSNDEKISRRKYLRSTTSMKINDFKDWRGKITQPNLPDVRDRLRRQQSATLVSPQRPCTAASNLSKSRADSTTIHMNETHKDNQQTTSEMISSTHMNVSSAPVNSVLKQSSILKQRQRSYPLNVRISETINQFETDQSSTENRTDPPVLSLPSEVNEEQLKLIEINPHCTPDTMVSKSTTPYTHESSEENLNKKSYRLILNSSSQIYRTVPQTNQQRNSNETNQQLNDLTLSQLELLENYDPIISTRIGVPFIPIQMLQRPKDAHLSSKRSIQQIENNYPKKKGQPVFEIRSTNNLIDISQTLQLTKSKRIPIQRQTTFEKPENENLLEEAVQIKSIENPNRLTLSIYSSPTQRSMIKHLNSTRTSSKAQHSQFDINSYSLNIIQQQPPPPFAENFSLKDEQKLESNLNVINLRTQQEVDQMRRKDRFISKRPLFPTSIVTNLSISAKQQKNLKQQGRPISSVFITQDPDEVNYSTSIYRQARTDVDIKRVFKGSISENLQRKLSANERQKREEQQIAAIKIQRAYREHLQRCQQIENRRPSTAQTRQQDRDHRRILSAKRAQFVEQQLIQQTKTHQENKEYQQMIKDTGPSLQIFKSFNQIDAQFSKSTLNRAATCIQRWWKGFILRHRWNYLKQEVFNCGLTWSQFAFRYRSVVERIQQIRQSELQQFIFNLDQTRDFLLMEKKLTTIYDALSFNGKLDSNELEQFFQSCDLSVTQGEIDEALKNVLRFYPQKKTDSLTKDIVFDVVYYIFPPVATGLETSRKSTWIRPIIDGEDETAIQGTPFLEPINLDVVYKFLGKQ